MNYTNKNKLLHLAQYLYKHTDDEHPATSKEIIEFLEGKGISINRHTLPTDIDALQEFGVDIITINSMPKKYFIGSRRFELPELKLLVDAVDSAKFITPKKSKELIGKLTALTSTHRAEVLNRHTYVAERVKPNNESVYYTVDILHSAINAEKKINFKYYTYTSKKQKEFKHNGEIYTVSPYALVWNDDRYYILGYCDKHQNISQFRVDRIAKLDITEDDCVPKPIDFNVAEYTKKVFDMYDGGIQTVKLICDNELMNVIVDKFGEQVQTEVIDGEHFKAIVQVAVSPTFFGWLFTFAGKMKLTAPEDIKSQYVNMAQKVISE